MARIRLLQALDYADPDNLGGASRMALALGEELAAQGWDVTCFAGCAGREGFRQGNGVSVCTFPSRLSERRTFASNVALLRRPAQVLRRHYRGLPHLLLCHQPFVTWALRRLPARIPRVYYFHSPWAEECRARGAGRRPDAFLQLGVRLGLERWALRRASAILVASDFMRRQLARFHRGSSLRDKVAVLPHGIDTDRFRPRGDRGDLRRRLELPAGRRVLITTRRLEARMGLEELLAALRLCRAGAPDLYLVIVGRGRLEERLKATAGELGLSDCVRFWGYASDEDLPALYSAADLFVLPTQALEGFGLVVLEAGACGLPVVATPVGAIPEIVGRMGAHLLAAGTDPASLAAAIGGALRHEASAGARYREFVVENYSWRSSAKAFAAMAAALLDARAPVVGPRPCNRSSPYGL